MPILLFSINIEICVSFEITPEIFKLITSENLNNHLKLRTRKRIVIRSNKFTFSPPKFLEAALQ